MGPRGWREGKRRKRIETKGKKTNKKEKTRK